MRILTPEQRASIRSEAEEARGRVAGYGRTDRHTENIIALLDSLDDADDRAARVEAALLLKGDPDARMDAYYYSFDPTGIGAIDDILSAVAHAGKAFHGTDMWTEEWHRTLPHGGATPEEGIQRAAVAAAGRIRAALRGES